MKYDDITQKKYANDQATATNSPGSMPSVRDKATTSFDEFCFADVTLTLLFGCPCAETELMYYRYLWHVRCFFGGVPDPLTGIIQSQNKKGDVSWN
jgi:hypothetical protein